MTFNGSLFTVSLALDSLVIMALILVLCRLMSRASASLRHQMIAGAFVAILVLPILVLSVPAWNTGDMPDFLRADGIFRDTGSGREVPAGSQDGSGNAKPAGQAVPVDTENLPRAVISEGATGENPTETAGIDPETGSLLSRIAAVLLGRIHLLLIVVWAGGASAILIVQLVRWAGAGFVAEMSSELQDDRTLSIAERVREESGLERPVSILRSEMTAVTMAWGLFSYYIILPSDSDAWSVDKMEEVLRHEMAHLKRRDNMVLLLAVFACAVYWFNPLVWKALKRLHYEREVSCDDFVLNSGGTPSSYARHLMEISIKLSGAKSGKIIPAAMAHSSDVKKRLLSVLDPSRNRRPAGVAASIVSVLLVIGLAMPVAAFRPWEVRAAEASETCDIESMSAESIESILMADEDDDKYTKEEIKKLKERLRELKKQRELLRKEQIELLRRSGSEMHEERAERSRALRKASRAERARASERAKAVSSSVSRVYGSSRDEDGLADRYHTSAQWKINGTICSGEDRYRLDRTTLENCERDYMVESKKVILDPDSDERIRFESERGFLKITLNKDDDLVEYWIEPVSGDHDGDIERIVHLNGSEVPLDAGHKREIDRILDEITGLLGDIGYIGSGSSEIYFSGLEAPELEGLKVSIGDGDLIELSELVPVIEDIELGDLDEEDALVIVNGKVMSAGDDHDELELRSHESERLDYLHDEIDELSDVFEEFAEVFEEIKDYHVENFEDHEAGRVIEEIYYAREPRISRLLHDGIRMVEDEHDFEKAIEIVEEILKEYGGVAIKAIDSVEDRRSRRALKRSLVELYRDLGESARDVLDDIEDDDGEASRTERLLYELLLENSRATRREIERK